MRDSPLQDRFFIALEKSRRALATALTAHLTLICVCSLYGVDIQVDNVSICRAHLLRIFAEYVVTSIRERGLVTPVVISARRILKANIIVGNFLTPEANTICQQNWRDHRFMRRKIGNIRSAGWKLLDLLPPQATNTHRKAKKR